MFKTLLKSKKFWIVFSVLVVAFVVTVSVQPADFKISRTTAINAPVSTVFAEVNDFHRWANWSPWAKLDPQMKTSYEGPNTGNGAIYSWDGNRQVGAGKMTILQSSPPEYVEVLLEFQRPMKQTNHAVFFFKSNGPTTTVVTWSMTGKNGFFGKAFHLVMNMEKLVGPSFEQGLAQMKSNAEMFAKK